MWATLVAGFVGLVIGAVAVAAVRTSDRQMRTVPPAEPAALPAGVVEVLSVLRSIAIVLDSVGAVVNASASAAAYGLIRGGDIVSPELRELVDRVRRDQTIREVDLDLARGPMGGRSMRVRVAPLSAEHLIVLVEDRTEARRVEEVRRDFVVNVSHELKTPVGGLALLAEAVADAKDDPESVARFAARMQVEATRLSQLVKEVVDLSRLQVADVIHEPELVDIGSAVKEAVDHTKVAAQAKQIDIEVRSEPGLEVYGDTDLVITAVRNLISNAIAYSEADTRVAIGARRSDDTVEISVADQGHGIPERDRERIFERFYKVDVARSRATGGTGLGLAIVKHICANHGGDVSLWSEVGQGSTFTIRLPAAVAHDRAPGGGHGNEDSTTSNTLQGEVNG